MPHLPYRSRYFRAGPVGEALTRAELVERLRLLWQSVIEAQAPAPSHELRWAIEQLLEAFGLTAERDEILGYASTVQEH
jgi:hypothetical protein